MKRLQLANAQGVDYTYNERSWLTQINHQNLNSTDDPGHDGTNGVAEDKFAEDKFAEVIGYNDQGHIASGTGFNFQAQYNGNISWIITRTKGAELPDVDAGVVDPIIGYVFNYDGANRLTKADFGFFSNTLQKWDNTLSGSAMYELPLINYDANGNIEYLQRNGVEGTLIDNFDYIYQGTNKLESITGRGSYTYDYNGNMLTDTYTGISDMLYNTSNLPEQLTVDTTTVSYWYNADGQRIRKQADDVDEIYVYGADGQTEAVFDATGSLKFFNINTGTENIGRLEAAAYELRLTNATLTGTYTGNNIIVETNVNVTGTAQLKAGVSVTLKPGFRAAEGCSLVVSIDTTLVVEPEKYYYVKDHLGSTRVTVDEEGEIASYYDYDPWGMVLDGRNNNYGIANEKYKFTGKERDDETNYDYFGARYYDARIGRWLKEDPLGFIYPNTSPYRYCSNNPVNFYDPNGLWDDSTKYPVRIGDYVLGDYGLYELKDVTKTAPRYDPFWFGGSSFGSSGGTFGLAGAFGYLGTLGTIYDTGENLIANDYFIWGKNGKFYKTGKGLNQHSGSKLSAFEHAKILKYAGRLIFLTKVGIATVDLQANFNWGKFGGYAYELGTDALSFAGTPGLLMSLYIQVNVEYAKQRNDEFQNFMNKNPSEEDIKTFMNIRLNNDLMMMGK